MTSDSGPFMVVFLILILIFALFITFLLLNAKKTTESYGNFQPNTHNIAPGKKEAVAVAKNWRNTLAISRKICRGSSDRLANANRKG
jgi:hypothetical protein